MKKHAAYVIIFLALLAATLNALMNSAATNVIVADTPPSPSPAPETDGVPAESPLPEKKAIDGLAHAWQTFNNCSSVGLLIALSRWNIDDTQEQIARGTRPWNNPKGDNDDKSVTLYELADYAARYDMAAYVRPNGDIELLKKFVAEGIPVVARALMYPDKDFVHYRVIRGYDDDKRIVIESDGIEGPNRAYSYDEWMHLWKDFNYSYLVVVPHEKREVVDRILGAEEDENIAWQNAKKRAEGEIAKDPNDMRAHYNLVTALYYLGDYEGTVREFEVIGPRLTAHKLWYQMEPIEAYFELGKFDRVIALADSVINANNASVSELYMMKGEIYESRGDVLGAKAEYAKALYYNSAMQAAKDAFKRLGA